MQEKNPTFSHVIFDQHSRNLFSLKNVTFLKHCNVNKSTFVVHIRKITCPKFWKAKFLKDFFPALSKHDFGLSPGSPGFKRNKVCVQTLIGKMSFQNFFPLTNCLVIRPGLVLRGYLDRDFFAIHYMSVMRKFLSPDDVKSFNKTTYQFTKVAHLPNIASHDFDKNAIYKYNFSIKLCKGWNMTILIVTIIYVLFSCSLTVIVRLWEMGKCLNNFEISQI